MNLRKTNRIKFFQQTRVILLDFLLDYVEFSLPLNLSGTWPSSGGAVKGVAENGGGVVFNFLGDNPFVLL